MPHIIVKMYKGRSDDVKLNLAKEIVKDVTEIAGCKEQAVSVAFEEYDPAEWAEKVYRPDILERQDELVIKPGYNPFESNEQMPPWHDKQAYFIKCPFCETDHIVPKTGSTGCLFGHVSVDQLAHLVKGSIPVNACLVMVEHS